MSQNIKDIAEDLSVTLEELQGFSSLLVDSLEPDNLNDQVQQKRYLTASALHRLISEAEKKCDSLCAHMAAPKKILCAA